MTGSQIVIDADYDDGVVLIDSGDGERRLNPDAARQFAAAYATKIESGEVPDTAGTRQVVDEILDRAEEIEADE